MQKHLEVSADHAVAIKLGWTVVGTGGRVLRDLAKDPRIGGSGTTDHDGVAAGSGDHGGGIFRGANISVADDGKLDRVLDGCNVLPAGLAAVAVLAGAGVEGHSLKATVFCHLCEFDADDVLVVPSHAELDGKGDSDSLT